MRDRLPVYRRAVSLFLFAIQSLLPLPAIGQETPAVAERPDQAVEEDLRDRLSEVEGMQGVQADYEGGIVTLSGKVDDSSLRVSAEEIAQALPSVVEVKNELVLGGKVSDRVGNALDRSLLKLQMAVGYLPLFVVAVVVVILFAWMGGILARSGVPRRFVGGNRFLQEIASQGLKVGVFLIGLVIALDLLDATALVGAVFGAAGVAGLAIGFAFRDLIENYVASLLLSVRRPFKPNDHVVIDGQEGRVISLSTRATILMTLDGNHLRLPNSLVFKSVILNYTTNAERRFDFVVGVGVEEDLNAAQELGVATLSDMAGVMEDPPPWAMIASLADSSVSIQFFGWVDQSAFSYAKVRSEAIRLVKSRLESAGMDLPEPIHRVRLENWSPAQTPPAATKRDSSSKPDPDRRLQQGDVSRDDAIERQVKEEASKAGSRNLLLDDAPPE
ncbi:mechanosensitive ion channel family protein [Pelagicoccus sp. SDUM812003]|uniref:mechanosensitive ion channel family protein n=1 Tax=Pelagicoccus sp. SDUM812003 TaxID=3041267 RepID=UPI00280E4E7F|nr:mechanosensitive ion channel family protein [Pelagicoccus sp. SDUM812003]MDQ8203398.1 mechanosensitive ion channel family protein [Pelagicoccus sp. SDUM812003]